MGPLEVQYGGSFSTFVASGQGMRLVHSLLFNGYEAIHCADIWCTQLTRKSAQL